MNAGNTAIDCQPQELLGSLLRLDPFLSGWAFREWVLSSSPPLLGPILSGSALKASGPNEAHFLQPCCCGIQTRDWGNFSGAEAMAACQDGCGFGCLSLYAAMGVGIGKAGVVVNFRCRKEGAALQLSISGYRYNNIQHVSVHQLHAEFTAVKLLFASFKAPDFSFHSAVCHGIDSHRRLRLHLWWKHARWTTARSPRLANYRLLVYEWRRSGRRLVWSRLDNCI